MDRANDSIIDFLKEFRRNEIVNFQVVYRDQTIDLAYSCSKETAFSGSKHSGFNEHQNRNLE